MNEIIQINWLLLIGPFLWILGIAVILALLGFMEFFKTSQQIKRSEFLKKPIFKNGVLISIGLIIAGFILYFLRLPSQRLIAVKIEKPKTFSITQMPAIEESRLFSPNELEIDSHNKSHVLNNEKMKDNTMVLFWDGYIHTPFVRFKKGDYKLEFEAKGSRAKEEYAKIKVEFAVPDEKNYLIARTVKYIELTGRMKLYHIDFKTETDTIGKIRITYFNDLHVPEEKEGRDIWLKNLAIIKI
jgi:hypothetical protein